MNFRVLVTGANGFIGANLIAFLLKCNYRVTALVRYGSELNLLNRLCQNRNNLEIKFVDFKNESSLSLLISNHNVVIHLAAQTAGKDFDDLYKANVSLCKTLIDIINKVEQEIHFIFLSSQAATGVSINNIPKKVSDTPKPLTWYGQTKLIAEEYIKTNLNKNWTIIRPASVYGRGDSDFLHYFKMIDKGILLLPSRKKQSVFSHIYVDNLCQIIKKCIGNEVVYNEILHASDSISSSFEHFLIMISCVIKSDKCTISSNDETVKSLKKIHVMIDIPISIVKISARISELWWRLNFALGIRKKYPIFNQQKLIEINQNSWLLDNGKTEVLLDFKSTNSLFTNLHETYQWYKENHYL